MKLYSRASHSNKQVPTVGVDLGIERVFAIIEQHEKENNQVIRASVTEVLVSILGKDLILAAELANELWSAGIKAEFKLTTRELDHIKYVTQTGIPWMVLVGQGELEMWPPLYGQWLCRLSVFGVCRRVCSASTRIFSALL
uniref:Anticodon-binding domain-containing protein n=1 Tax=Aegilops tauschii subsp. strangulata TaxID=200361 RepID=A0A453AX57_AEGTS